MQVYEDPVVSIGLTTDGVRLSGMLTTVLIVRPSSSTGWVAETDVETLQASR